MGSPDTVIDLHVPRRQSPWAIAFLAFRIVRSVGTIQAVVAFFFLVTRGLDGRLLAALPIVGALLLAGSLLSWWRFTFQVDGDEFIVRSGVLQVDRLSVPISRIQSVSIEQELLHRVVGVVRVSLDTAGSEQTEFRIDAIPRPVAEELRRLTGRTGTTRPSDDAVERAPDVASRTLLAHSPGRLILAALTSWPWTGLVVLAPLFALLDQAGDSVPRPDIDPGTPRWWWIPLTAAAVVSLAVVLNVVRVTLQNWALTVELDETTLRRSSGLLSRRTDARAASRVQVVSTNQNPMQRRFGLTALTLSSIGDGSLAVIGCDGPEVASITRSAGGTPAHLLDPQLRIHRAEIWLAVRNATVVALLVGSSAAVVLGWWAAAVVVIVPTAWLRTRRHVREFRWNVTSSELIARGRIIDDWSRQSLLRTTNGVRITRSLFERRRDLARVHVDTAAGSISIGMLPADQAAALRDHVLASVLADDDPWM